MGGEKVLGEEGDYGHFVLYLVDSLPFYPLQPMHPTPLKRNFQFSRSVRTATFLPDSRATACAFDLIHANATTVLGGERFLYQPEETSLEFQQGSDRSQANIQFPSKGLELHLYPVPVRDILKVEITGSPSNLAIFDALGKQRLAYNTRNKQEQIQFNVSVLPPGLYFLRAFSDDGLLIGTVRFIKL